MKIGIVTVEKSANVGSFLQAYALQKVLEAWGHEAYFVSAGQESFFKREYCWFIPKRGNLKYPKKNFSESDLLWKRSFSGHFLCGQCRRLRRKGFSSFS